MMDGRVDPRPRDRTRTGIPRVRTKTKYSSMRRHMSQGPRRLMLALFVNPTSAMSMSAPEAPPALGRPHGRHDLI